MPKEESIKNLGIAKRILESLDVPFCLFLGTALGAYRDGDFCPGDEDDIDLAVDISDLSKGMKIIEAFESEGFVFKRYDAPNAMAPEFAFIKEHAGWHTKVDIFFLVPIGDSVVWTFYSQPAQNRSVYNFFREFDTVEFHGMRLNCPSPIEEYLEANYGDWKTPIHRKHWQWDKDNKCPQVYGV